METELIKVTTSLRSKHFAGAVMQDTFGVLSNGQQWALYTYQQGGSSVFFEHYELSMTGGKKVFIPQLSKLMSALVGIVKFQSSVMQ